MLMLQEHHGFLSLLGSHPSKLRNLCGRNSGYLLAKSVRERSGIYTVECGGRFLEDLTSIHLGYVSHLLWLPTVGEHLIGVDAMVHESGLNYLAWSHHRTVRHRVPSNTTGVHKLASSIIHHWIRRLLHSIEREF